MESGLYDLSGYDALQLRVRGDGRRFIANLSAPSIGRKDDIWQAFAFTRGGPEWEDITVRPQQSSKINVHAHVAMIYHPHSITRLFHIIYSTSVCTCILIYMIVCWCCLIIMCVALSTATLL